MIKNTHKTADNTLDERVQHFAQYLLLMRKLQDKNSAEFLDSLGDLSMQELNVLNTIGDNEPCIMSAIAKQVSLSLSSVTVIVDKLVKAKLVKRVRNEEDRRVVHGSLTAEGKKIYQRQIEHIREVVRKLFAVLTVTEQEDILKIFQKFARALM